MRISVLVLNRNDDSSISTFIIYIQYKYMIYHSDIAWWRMNIACWVTRCSGKSSVHRAFTIHRWLFSPSCRLLHIIRHVQKFFYSPLLMSFCVPPHDPELHVKGEGERDRVIIGPSNKRRIEQRLLSDCLYLWYVYKESMKIWHVWLELLSVHIAQHDRLLALRTL